MSEKRMEGWATKTNPRNKQVNWHYYRNGKALCCSGSNYCLDVDKLKASPEISKSGKQTICKKCRERSL